MCTTLSELPFFSEESYFSQPPFVSEDSVDDRFAPPLDRMAVRESDGVRGAQGNTWTETSPTSNPLDATLSELPLFPFFSEDRVDYLPLPPTPPSVCEKCWKGPFAMHFGIPCISPQNGKWYRHWPNEITYVTTPRKLSIRADAGCVWCRFICDHRSVNAYDTSPELVEVTVRGIRKKPKENWRRHGEYQRLDVKIDRTEYHLIIYAALDDLAASYITTRSPILTDVKSPSTLDLAKQLINECVDKHELCKAAASLSPRRPTRLVDCTDLAHPRLVSAPGREHGQYLALSYVWGKDSEQTPYRTTTSNLSTYEHGIDPSVLPLTIHDAIYVTHTLGFRWLWVDSLCIIQDSDEDKAHEIGRMHHIYRYAHVTIMAGSAEGVGSGFLQERSPPNDVAFPCICPPYPPNSTERQYDHSAPQKLQVGQVYLADRYKLMRSYENELGCMATRAWCMQECLLSPRALIFTPRTILFRCLTTEAGAVGVSNLHYSIVGEPRIPTSLFLPPTAPAPEPDSEEWRKMCRAWMYVIHDYTRRTASDPSDKLVACAAVAEQFHRALGSEYLAGIWRSDALLLHLLWRADHDNWTRGNVCGHRHARPAAFRAPSWSWAAIEGPVQFEPGYSSTGAFAEVTECWVTLEDPALPFGRVTDGALVLRGAPILCNSSSAIKDVHYQSFAVPLPSFGEVQHQWRCGLWGLILDEEDGIYPRESGDPYADVTLDCDVDEPPGRMWLVPFVQYRWSEVDNVYGIVLELAFPSHGESRSASSERVRFRRIGYFRHGTGIKMERPGGDFQKHPLWGPLIRAVEMGDLEPLWTDIEIV